MIPTRIISDLDEVEHYLPKCIEFERKCAATVPINYIAMSFIWWNHFNNRDGTMFGKKRGRNYFGAQSWLETFYLLIAEKDTVLYGVAPLVSHLLNVPGQPEKLRMLAFAGDPALIPYQDFIVLPKMRAELITSLFSLILELLEKRHDLLFLGQIPEKSLNIPIVRQLLSNYDKKNLCIETSTAQRSGVWPWTIKPLFYRCNELLEKVTSDHFAYEDLKSVVEALQNTSPQKLFFPRTRKAIEDQLIDILEKLEDVSNLKEDINNINLLLYPVPLPHPYITLPSDKETFLMSLRKETRRFFRRYRRRFIEQGGYFEKLGSEEITELDINDYLSLHIACWGDESTAINDLTADFHRDFSVNAAMLGYLTLFFARVQKRRIAAHVCFDFLTRREGYYTGRDPKFSELRAGRLLYLETIYDAIDNGFRIYDLGAGGDEYKQSFSNNNATTHNFVLKVSTVDINLNQIFNGFEFMSQSSTYIRNVI